MSLFRAQAILALTSPRGGELLIATPPGWRTGVLLATTFLLLGAITLAVLEMPRKAMASGVLVPVLGLNWVHAPVAGAVEAIHVRHGDTVRRGQPLLRISHDADVSGRSFGALDKSIDGQIMVLRQRVHLAREQRRLLQHEHRNQLDQLRTGLVALRDDLRLESDKARIADATFAAARTAAVQGALTPHERDRAEATWLDSRQRLQALRADLEARESQRQSLPAAQSRELRELDAQVAAITLEQRVLEQRRLELRLSRGTDVAAPVTGRIIEIRPDAGAFVAAQSPQIAILPDGDHLQAELQVPSSALGFVHPGTTLRLHLESFPHAKFGAVEGTVTEVAPVLQPPEPGRGFTLPTFRVFARLDTTKLRRGDQTFTLQPDMRLSAFVLLERRKAWEWLFDPLLDALRR